MQKIDPFHKLKYISGYFDLNYDQVVKISTCESKRL